MDKEFVTHWRRIGPRLEAIRRRELQHLDLKERGSVIDALLQIGCDRAAPRNTSGLVELARLLAKRNR
jgi:hypothetical protein